MAVGAWGQPTPVFIICCFIDYICWNNFSFLSFVDSDYDHKNFQIEKYNFGPVADLDLLVDCYNFLSKNYYQYVISIINFSIINA